MHLETHDNQREMELLPFGFDEMLDTLSLFQSYKTVFSLNKQPIERNEDNIPDKFVCRTMGKLPFKMSEIAAIFNPKKNNELMIFGGQDTLSKWVYNIDTNQWDEFASTSPNSIYNKYFQTFGRCRVKALAGLNDNSIVIHGLGNIDGDLDLYIAEWNIMKSDWDFVQSTREPNTTTTCTWQGKGLKFKNYLVFINDFILGGDDVSYHCCVYKYNPNRLRWLNYNFNLGHGAWDVVASFRGLKECNFGKSYIIGPPHQTQLGSNYESNKIDIFIFGYQHVALGDTQSAMTSFSESFESIEIDFNDENNIKIKSTDKYKILTHDNQTTKLNYLHAANMVYNRYLVLTGGLRYQYGCGSGSKLDINPQKMISYFDFWEKKWYTSDVELSEPMHQHTSIVDNKRDILHLFGSKNDIHLCLDLRQVLQITIQWKCERIIWIGYKLNQNGQQCLFAKISKDIVIYILAFLH